MELREHLRESFSHNTDIRFCIKSVDSLIDHDSPFMHSVVKPEYATYISDECRERLELFQPGQELTLVFTSLRSSDGNNEEKLDELRCAVYDSIDQKLVMLRHERAASKRSGFWSLIVGGLGVAVFSVFTLGVFPYIKDSHTYFAGLLKSIMEVLLWVSIWFPIEKLVFEEWPLKAQLILHERLSQCTILLEHEPKRPSPRSPLRQQALSAAAAAVGAGVGGTDGMASSRGGDNNRPPPNMGGSKGDSKKTGSMMIAHSEDYMLYQDKV